MSTAFKAACLQLNSERDVAPNIESLRTLARRARDQGADLIMTPEVSDMIEHDRALRFEKARAESEHPMLAAARELARELDAHLLLGSIVVKLDQETKTFWPVAPSVVLGMATLAHDQSFESE